MSEEKKPKKKKMRGFPGFINNMIENVKDTDKCKDLIRGIRTRVLLNNQEDEKRACLITVDKDQIKVESIEKKGKKSLSRKTLYWWGYWEFPSLATMLKAGSWKTGKWIRKMAGGKVKGASQIAIIGEILALARES